MTCPWRLHAGHATRARFSVVLSRKTTLQARQPTRWPSSRKVGGIAVLLSHRQRKTKRGLQAGSAAMAQASRTRDEAPSLPRCSLCPKLLTCAPSHDYSYGNSNNSDSGAVARFASVVILFLVRFLSLATPELIRTVRA